MKLSSLLYYRNRLDAHDQAIYDDLFQHWMHLEDDFTIQMPHCSMRELVQAVHLDNPILFYINYYEVTYFKSPTTLRIQGGYLYRRDQIQKYLSDCEAWGKHIIKKLPNVGIAEKALWLHDVIIANVTYGNSVNINSHNLIGVIKDKVAVCEGISKTYKFLCDLANIPCIVVTGEMGDEPHGWNMLWVGGGTSFVDVTNDIRNGGGYDRDHFLRSADEMKGYTWDTSVIPNCKIRNKTNAFFTARTKQEFIDTVRRNIEKESLSISLEFGYKLSNSEINNLLNSCYLPCPQLRTKQLSYSPEAQVVYIRK